MGWIGKIAWALGMWFCGSCVMSWFGSQIRITNRCAKRILSKLENALGMEYYWDSKPCRKYLNSVVIKNFVIITVISAVVLFLIPSIGKVFYFVGMIISWVVSIGLMGITQQNVEETASIFARYAKHNKAEDIQDFVFITAQQIINEAEVEAMLRKQ